MSARRNEVPHYSEADRDRVEAELALRELAHRKVGGLAVFLYWHKGSNTLSEVVIDDGLNQTIVFSVPNDKGLDAFYHPFPYAQREGVGFSVPKPNAD